MNNISNLTLLLLGLSFTFIILILIFMCVRVTKNKKAFNRVTGVFMSLAILSVLGTAGSIMFKDKIPNNVQTLKSGNSIHSTGKNSNKVKVISSSSKSGAAITSSKTDNTSQPFVAEPFDPTGSVRPKIIKDDTVNGIGAIIDADGTETRYHFSDFLYDFVINPDKTAFGYTDYTGNDGNPGTANLYLFIPNGKSVSGGNGCTQYSFDYESGIQTDYITQCDSYFTDNSDYTINDDNSGTGKMQTLTDTTMTPGNFINQMLPEPKPAKTVENHILNGQYQYVNKQIVSSSTPVTLFFNGNEDVVMRNDYMNNSDIYNYKLEPVGKNAYRLYLYKYGTGVDQSNENEALKNTFFIYMDSKDSFDFVFFTDLNRYQVTLTR